MQLLFCGIIQADDSCTKILCKDFFIGVERKEWVFLILYKKCLKGIKESSGSSRIWTLGRNSKNVIFNLNQFHTITHRIPVTH
jgi:hypothetical protein